MDEDTLARATEPFFTTKGIGKGTGLGLSMAQSFAAQSGGQFVLRSTQGDGTVAELWLPVSVETVRPHPVAPLAADHDGNADGHVHAQVQGLVVLAVDDDRLVLMNTTTSLNKLGHRVYTAVSGRQALEAIRREDGINLVIIDHALPDMTGADLAELIRAEWPSMPIIFATPLADVSVQQVAKPFRDGELSQAIARVGLTGARTGR
jgi:CheY-like chemotaxis protein